MVRWGVVVGQVQARKLSRGLLLPVTVGADLVSLPLQAETVGVVAIGTKDSLLIHPALQERSIDVHFFANLPVWEIEPLSQRLQAEVVAEGAVVRIPLTEPAPS